MWSKILALLEILKWAEKHDKTVVTEDAFNDVVTHFMEPFKQQALNASIWGFLSSCLTGSAETIFRSAEDLNGLDAWRRVVRIIDSGLLLRLEELRGEVRMLHTRPMKDLEQVTAGDVVCTDYASCLTVLKDNRAIKYVGPAGRMAYDARVGVVTFGP